MKQNKIDVAIVGASGYTGLELVKTLHVHPIFNITYIANSTGNVKIQSLHKSLNGFIDMDVQKVDIKKISSLASVVFLALPHKTSMQFAKQFLQYGIKVVDLSADYRLKLDTYEEYYCPHEDKENLENSVYGLPEFYKKDIQNATLVANPGCYPTGSILPLVPFVKYLDDKQSVFIDAKSGISGAGKKASEMTSFVNISENMFSYNPLQHRHTPEIIEKIQLICKKDLKINFVPHLLPVIRGMLTSVYCTVNQKINAKEVLEEYYTDNEFVRISSTPVSMKDTSGTNYCDIFVQQDGNDLFINSSIDNLLRGASSQAVVNANLMCGLEENTGISKIAYVP